MSGCPIHGNTVQLSSDISMPAFGLDDDSMKRIAGEITDDTLINKGLFDYTRKNLISGIDNVYGNIKYDDPAFGKVQEMKRNLANFAGFKSFHQTNHIRQAKPEQLPAINGKYNVNWMRTEYVHTVRSARGAKNWQRYEADKDLYPYLEYMPSTAAEPRNDHKRLYGVVKPVDDPFWDTWMPPADWGCQCGVRQVRNNADAVEPPEDIKLPPKAMRNNPGKTGKIITDRHPMMGRVGNEKRNVINDWVELYLRTEASKEVKEWTKTNIPMEGLSITNNSFKTGKIILQRRGVKDIAAHFTKPTWKLMALDIEDLLRKRLTYLNSSTLEESVKKKTASSIQKKINRGVEKYNYYEFQWAGMSFRLNVEVIKGEEYVYSVNKIKAD